MLLPARPLTAQRALWLALLLIIPWIAAALTVSSPSPFAEKKIGGLGQNGGDDGSPGRRVVVVGGGVGGLAVASRIAASSKGVQVAVFEKNAYAGGRCGSFEVVTGKGTFRHERGPSLLLLPDVYRDLFRDCQEECPFEIRQCSPAYQVVFDDGDRIDLGFPKQQNAAIATDPISAAESKSRSKMNALEPNGAAKWDEYMTACAAFLDCGLPNFIEERFDIASFPAFLQQALRDGAKAWPLKPHSDVLDATFASCKMRALASFQDLYVGLEPHRNDRQWFGGVLQSTAPAVFGLLAAIELHPTNEKCGVYAPVGGFGAVAFALEELATNLGVTVQCNTMVTKITEDGLYYRDTHSDNDTTQFEPADLVIVNADLPYATKTILLSDDSFNASAADRFDWDDKYRLSSGVVAFHWSVDKELTDLNTHNVFLSASSRSEAEASWQTLREEQTSATSSTDTPFNFYVHRASKTDPTAAPEVSPHRELLSIRLFRILSQFCLSIYRDVTRSWFWYPPKLSHTKQISLNYPEMRPSRSTRNSLTTKRSPASETQSFVEWQLLNPSKTCNLIFWMR
jgi:phytoene desaturase (3,4-didehydrolycopene-forming)